jgi:hypothetical protein
MVEIRETQNHRNPGAKNEHYTAESILTELRKGHTDEAMRELNRDHWALPRNFAKLYGQVNNGIDALNKAKHLNLPKLELVHPNGKVDSDANSDFNAYKLGDTKYSTKSVHQKESVGPAGDNPAGITDGGPNAAPHDSPKTRTSGRDKPEDFEAVTRDPKAGTTATPDAVPKAGTTATTDADPKARTIATTDADPKARTTATTDADPKGKPTANTPPVPSKFSTPDTKEMTEEQFNKYREAISKVDAKYRDLMGSRVGYVDEHGGVHEQGADGSRLDNYNGNGPQDPNIGEVRVLERKANGDTISTNANGDVKTRHPNGNYQVQRKNGDYTEVTGNVGLYRHTENGITRENHWHQGAFHRDDNYTKTTWPDGSTELTDMNGKKISTPATAPAAKP